ncbi:hypothetical protein EDB89DRAFT_900706 [Lactarius sanguifluus]|nr:hypothetical protein EDB89DRAFT_900706 [Lactarius sanguifluus]
MATSSPERGPGLPHWYWYMLPHADLRKTHGRPIVLYDQLGTSPPASPRAFSRRRFSSPGWTTSSGTSASSATLTCSWGVTLAVEYIAAHRSQGLKHLIRTNGSASYPLRRAVVRDLRSRWPQDYRDMMSHHEREGAIDAREYQEGLVRFYRKHALNLEVWPPEATRSLTQMGRGPYGPQGDVRVLAVPGLSPSSFQRCISWALPCASLHRLGVDEFVMTGVLKDSVIPKLGMVSCPTLIINGADDAVQDSSVAPLFYGIGKAKWVTLGSGSHLAFWE